MDVDLHAVSVENAADISDSDECLSETENHLHEGDIRIKNGKYSCTIVKIGKL